jgi:hypothetical protein
VASGRATGRNMVTSPRMAQFVSMGPCPTRLAIPTPRNCSRGPRNILYGNWEIAIRIFLGINLCLGN